jgi:hypothetical protein
MKITRLNYYKNPDSVKRKVLVDTDRLKEKTKDYLQTGWVVIAGLHDRIESKIDNILDIEG